ncbi:FkbM family methyltransferase [Jannaschia sp. KMU-145]|uniref:FkbM family methyltransferase n=1 Tax=Jannaschia halovivens TaxID=3388667 RepID=UPI00396B43C8
MNDAAEATPRVRRRDRVLLHEVAGGVALGRRVRVTEIGARQTKEAPPYGALRAAGMAHVTAFEPEPDAYAALVADAPEHTTVHPLAIGAPGPATLYAHKIASLTSIFPFSAPAARFLGKGFWVNRPVTEIPVDLVALDDVPGLADGIDILKMDIQGAERDAIEGGRRALSECMVVIPEVRFYRMYDGEPMLAELDQSLRAQGFVLHKFLHQKSVISPSPQAKRLEKAGVRNQLLDGDAVYIRSIEDPETVTTDQLKVLALAAASVFDSPDLCCHCLHLLTLRGAVAPDLAETFARRAVPAMDELT